MQAIKLQPQPILRVIKNTPSILNARPILQLNKLAVATVDITTFIPFEEILYCKSESNYTLIYLRSGKSQLISKTLKSVEDKLPSSTFLRIHKSYLINITAITAFNRRTGEIEINHSQLCPIARHKRKEVYSMLV
ncbi:MAG: LytTR family DNA-binding domain-containing protein [Saprospiraceae bacterium]